MTGGEALNPDVREKWKGQVGLELHEGYGQSETVSAMGAWVPATGHLHLHPHSLGGDDQPAEPPAFLGVTPIRDCPALWEKLITKSHQLFFPFGLKIK